jgi:single-strand DNA-binding protein
MNLCIFSGRIGQDPQMGQLSSGDALLKFSLAVSVGRRDNPQTMWLRCTMFGRRAQALESILTKGQKVTVSGAVKLDEFTNKEGVAKQSLSMVVSDIELMSEQKGGEPRPAKQAAVQDEFGDDIPF